MNKINDRPHKKLLAWQKAIDMVVKIYSVTGGFPRKEDYGLTSQLRRAAVSVPSNIAEGLTRRTQADKLHFLNVSQSSLSEIDTQIEISRRLEYIHDESYESVENDLVHIQRLLGGLIRSIRS